MHLLDYQICSETPDYSPIFEDIDGMRRAHEAGATVTWVRYGERRLIPRAVLDNYLHIMATYEMVAKHFGRWERPTDASQMLRWDQTVPLSEADESAQSPHEGGTPETGDE